MESYHKTTVLSPQHVAHAVSNDPFFSPLPREEVPDIYVHEKTCLKRREFLVGRSKLQGFLFYSNFFGELNAFFKTSERLEVQQSEA